MAYQSKSHRKFLATSLTAAMVASAVAPTAGLAASSFPDVKEDSFYYDYVTALSEAGIIDGRPDGSFDLGGKLNRAEAAKMISKILELDTASAPAASFEDVKQGVWYSEYINALYAEGKIDGMTETEFAPNAELSRAQLAKLVVEAYGLELDGTVELPFTDVKEDVWYTVYIKTLYKHDLIDGTTATTFAPNDSIKRADFAKLLTEADWAVGSKLEKPGTEEPVVDTEAPVLTVDGLTNDTTVYSSMVTFSVEATDNMDETVTPVVMHGEIEVEVNEDGMYTVELAEGENTITVSAADAASNESEVQTFTYTYDASFVLATEAVVTAEESLLDKDLEAAQELVDALEESDEKVLLNARLVKVQAKLDSIIENVNDANGELALYNALNVAPFMNVNEDYIANYVDEMASVDFESVTEIQEAIDAVNKEILDAELEVVREDARTKVGLVVAADYTAENAAEEEAYLELVSGAQEAIDALPADYVYDEVDEETPLATVLQEELDMKVSLFNDYVNVVKAVVTAGNDVAEYKALVANFDHVMEAYVGSDYDFTGMTTVADIQYHIDFVNADNAVAGFMVDEDTTQADIDALKGLVEMIPNTVEDEEGNWVAGEDEALLLEAVAGFQTDLDNRDALVTATVAVEALLNEDGELVADQDAIDAAQDLLDAYEGLEDTTTLQNTIDGAQALLNAEVLEAATEAVEALTTTNEDAEVVLAQGVTQDNIDAAQDLVDSYEGDAVDVETLQADINEAQDLLFTAEINGAMTASELQPFLVNLKVNVYNNMTLVQRLEVAELFLDTIEEAEFTNTADIESALEVSVSDYFSLLDGVNTAETITETNEALNALNVDEYSSLSAADRLVAAEKVLNSKPEAGYTSIASILNKF